MVPILTKVCKLWVNKFRISSREILSLYHATLPNLNGPIRTLRVEDTVILHVAANAMKLIRKRISLLYCFTTYSLPHHKSCWFPLVLSYMSINQCCLPTMSHCCLPSIKTCDKALSPALHCGVFTDLYTSACLLAKISTYSPGRPCSQSYVAAHHFPTKRGDYLLPAAPPLGKSHHRAACVSKWYRAYLDNSFHSTHPLLPKYPCHSKLLLFFFLCILSQQILGPILPYNPVFRSLFCSSLPHAECY